MKKRTVSALLALVALICCAGTSTAQFNNSYSGWNGWNKIIIQSSLSGLVTGKTYYITPLASYNSSFSSIIAGKTDSFVATGATLTRLDTLFPTIPSPIPVCIKSICTTADSLGGYDTAGHLSYRLIHVTPSKVPVSQIVTLTSVTAYTALIDGVFNSGNDTADIYGIFSFGDTSFLNPVWFAPAQRDSIFPVFTTTNQDVSRTYVAQIGKASNWFSYKFIIKPRNGGKADTTQKYIGQTVPAPPPATVTMLQNAKVHNMDSITGDYYANPNNLAGTLVRYWTVKSTGVTDSSVTTFNAGAGIIKSHIAIAPLKKSDDYELWAVLRTSTTNYACAKTTLNTPGTKELIITADSLWVIDSITAQCSFLVEVPSGSSVDNLTFIADNYPLDPNSVPFKIEGFPSIGAGIMKITFTISNLIGGNQYIASAYASDTKNTAFYQPWDVKFIFTFKPPTTGVKEQPLNDIQINIYPNPATGILYIDNAKEYALYSVVTGSRVQSGENLPEHASISVSNLPAGMYILKSGKIVKRIIVQ